jgi:hypothetical protein
VICPVERPVTDPAWTCATVAAEADVTAPLPVPAPDKLPER